MVKVAIVGACGRMGRTLISSATLIDEINISAAIDAPGSEVAGTDIGTLVGVGTLNVPISTELQDNFDVLIDFTSPEASLEHIKWCVLNNKAAVVGTTGFNEIQKKQVEDYAKKIPIVLAPNMSVGVNLMWKLLEIATDVIGKNTDIEIIEAHHRFKKDAPSGTALKMGEVIASRLGLNLNECAVYDRQGITEERAQPTIGFATVRAGDIVGEHTALFADLGERLEITHKASNRSTFANGALRAAAWIVKKAPGLYDMQQVLGLDKVGG